MNNATSEKQLLDVEAGIPRRSNSATMLSRIQSNAPDLGSTVDLLLHTTIQHVTLRKLGTWLPIQPSWGFLIFWLLSTRAGYLILSMLESRVACETGRQQAVFYGVFVALASIVSIIGEILATLAEGLYA